MKKILTSFLLMAMIAGCVQQGPTEAEKPEEPPVVEQPEKPVEQEKPEEIDKIISVTNEPVNIQISVEYYRDQLFIQEPTLSWESKDAKKFNEEMIQLAQICRDELTYHEDGSWRTASLLNTKYYVNGNILSIVVKLDRLAANTTVGPSLYQTYNFSIKTHDLVTNDELLDVYQTSADEFQSRLNEQLNINYLSCSTPVEEGELLEKPCYNEYVGDGGATYGDSSTIYIKEGIIHMFVRVHLAYYQEFIDFAVYSL